MGWINIIQNEKSMVISRELLLLIVLENLGYQKNRTENLPLEALTLGVVKAQLIE
jgi:hypothetical protein